jgi:NifU-like protein involved in Fe-S cluster formation
VLKFDDNDVLCERDDEIVVFVRVGDVFDESDCGDVVELLVVSEVEIDEVVDIGVFEGGGRGISTISTTSEGPLELFPPPKNILFVDDVDASQ